MKKCKKMMQEVNPGETTRASAFALWMEAPMPMVTFFRTLDVTRLRRFARRRGLKFNMLMCWCIGRAAGRIEEFRLLPVGRKLMRFDRLGLGTIVADRAGGVRGCDIPFADDLVAFDERYRRLTAEVRECCADREAPGCMVIGTSALAKYRIDGAVGMYSGVYNNPFLIWGRWRRRLLRTTLSVSFQFHHTQMDGAHAARFLEALQQEIDGLGR